jgi:hypothetical protein
MAMCNLFSLSEDGPANLLLLGDNVLNFTRDYDVRMSGVNNVQAASEQPDATAFTAHRTAGMQTRSL